MEVLVEWVLIVIIILVYSAVLGCLLTWERFRALVVGYGKHRRGQDDEPVILPYVVAAWAGITMGGIAWARNHYLTVDGVGSVNLPPSITPLPPPIPPSPPPAPPPYNSKMPGCVRHGIVLYLRQLTEHTPLQELGEQLTRILLGGLANWIGGVRRSRGHVGSLHRGVRVPAHESCPGQHGQQHILTLLLGYCQLQEQCIAADRAAGARGARAHAGLYVVELADRHSHQRLSDRSGALHASGNRVRGRGIWVHAHTRRGGADPGENGTGCVRQPTASTAASLAQRVFADAHDAPAKQITRKQAIWGGDVCNGSEVLRSE